MIDELSKVWTEGKRHDLAGSLAGALRKDELKQEETELVMGAICSLAGDPEPEDRNRYIRDTYNKPLDEISGISNLSEILFGLVGEEKTEAIISHFKQRRKMGRSGQSQAKKLVSLLLRQNPLLFHDERKTPYIRLQSSSSQNLRLRSTEFRVMLAGLLWKEEEKVPGSEALASALNVLHHYSLIGPMVNLHNRLAWHEGALWLDLSDGACRAVKITKESWTIEKPPILFRRYVQQLPIQEPTRGGDPWKLLNYLNVCEGDRLISMSYIGTLFIPDIPHAASMLHGPQGSTKTTLFMILRELLDPSAVDVLTLPRDERELIQVLDHNYLAYFDNVGSLPDWASDALCRATTGTGFSKRQLYTDDEDVIYRFIRPVGVNGINRYPRDPTYWTGAFSSAWSRYQMRGAAR